MVIIKTYNWNRRDFSADLKCEHCGFILKNDSCYDDENYYKNVIPNQTCKECGESSNSKKSENPVKVTIPRYDANLVI
jgi:primosomal protein N'